MGGEESLEPRRVRTAYKSVPSEAPVAAGESAYWGSALRPPALTSARMRSRHHDGRNRVARTVDGLPGVGVGIRRHGHYTRKAAKSRKLLNALRRG